MSLERDRHLVSYENGTMQRKFGEIVCKGNVKWKSESEKKSSKMRKWLLHRKLRSFEDEHCHVVYVFVLVRFALQLASDLGID